MATAEGHAHPVLIIGAGVSGLLLAQVLRKAGIAFHVFERDHDFTTRGVGWGLTLHWSLPALHTLLPEDLTCRLPEAYVDRGAVERGEASQFPFFDLSTGELKAYSSVPESQRIRVTRERLRGILATGINIQWGKTFAGLTEGADSITASFEDGSSYVGSLVAACDGGFSAIRRGLFPDIAGNYRIPIQLVGLKVLYTEDQIAELRKLDSFFLQGTASANDSFSYFSILDVPGNNEASTDLYSLQICTSWPLRDGFWGNSTPTPVPPTNSGRIQLIKDFASTWAEPFRSVVLNIPDETEIKPITLTDWAPPKGLRSHGRVALFGDAIHAMAMYRGEGANHAIIDVLDFFQTVVPCISENEGAKLRAAIDAYEDKVVARTRRGVLASRQACLDAHDWGKITPESPLLSKRAMLLADDYEPVAGLSH